MRKNLHNNGNAERSGRDGLGRRDVLRAAPLLGLGACLPRGAAAAAETGETNSGRPGRDPVYRESEMMRRYYQRARF